MLRIENIRKALNRKVFANWVIRDINNHPTQGKYMFDIHCYSPLGVIMDRCTISLERRGRMLPATKPNTNELTYFFFYNGEQTNVCGGAHWLGDMDNFTAQLEYVITKYHNKQ